MKSPSVLNSVEIMNMSTLFKTNTNPEKCVVHYFLFIYLFYRASG